MPLATFHQNERLGEIVIDSPPQNLFSADLLADLGVAVNQAADSDIRALLLRAMISPRARTSRSSSGLTRPGPLISRRRLSR
jgi:hypothetical protein